MSCGVELWKFGKTKRRAMGPWAPSSMPSQLDSWIPGCWRTSLTRHMHASEVNDAINKNTHNRNRFQYPLYNSSKRHHFHLGVGRSYRQKLSCNGGGSLNINYSLWKNSDQKLFAPPAMRVKQIEKWFAISKKCNIYLSLSTVNIAWTTEETATQDSRINHGRPWCRCLVVWFAFV